MNTKTNKSLATVLKQPFSHTRMRRMLYCAIIAMLLNPTSWFLLNPFSWIASLQMIFALFCYVALYAVPYIVMGCAVDYWLRRIKWQLRTIAIWFSVNIIILSAIFFFFRPESSGSDVHCLSPLVLIIPVLSVIGSLLSIIPIGYSCKHDQIE